MGRILGVVVGRGSGIGDRRSVRGTVGIRQSENGNLFETKLHNTVASKRGYTDLPETSSRQLPMGSSSD